MAEPIDQTDRGFIEHWRRVGKEIARLEVQEMRKYRHQDHVEAINALLQIGAEQAKPRALCGLTELQRWLAQSGGSRQGRK